MTMCYPRFVNTASGKQNWRKESKSNSETVGMSARNNQSDSESISCINFTTCAVLSWSHSFLPGLVGPCARNVGKAGKCGKRWTRILMKTWTMNTEEWVV